MRIHTVYDRLLSGLCDAFDPRMALLPHNLFQCLTVPDCQPYVKHLLRPEHDAQRISKLKAAGGWLIDQDANGRPKAWLEKDNHGLQRPDLR